MKLNLGCGTRTPAGWVNVDYALGARCAKIPFFAAVNRRIRLFSLDWNPGILVHDLRRPFPWSDGSARLVYASHLLEHLTREEGRLFVTRCHAVLRAGGILRIVVPDLSNVVSEYSAGRLPADEFVERLGVLYGTGTSGVRRILSPIVEFPHRCMYDAGTLLSLLRGSGFQAEPRRPFESAIEDISDVELKERTDRAVIVEASKS